MHTRNVNSRLICSMAACFDETSTTVSSLQFGQSSQPRPEPVSRTAAPVTHDDRQQHQGGDADGPELAWA